MKFFPLLCLISSLLSVRSDIAADSPYGMDILKNSRLLANNNNNNNNQQASSQYKWMQSMSLKFQGCSQISQWNEFVQQDSDVRISTKRLVRYRLCPSDSCSSTNAAGCNAGYGDYVVDLNTFVYYYMQNKAYTMQYNCNYALNTACPCNGENCDRSQCLKTNGYDYCINYNANADNGGFVVENYLTCVQYADAAGNVYYLGPYCAGQGNRILMGMYSDATCTTFVDDTGGKSTFETAAGIALPYSNYTMVESACTSCKDDVVVNNNNKNNNNGNYALYDGTGVKQLCSKNYAISGKCETRLESISTQNTKGCTYLDGIKMTRTNGVIFSTVPSKSRVASAFIGLFSVCFIILGAYVYYLKSKLDRVKVNLSD